jgi:hypothetical protein
MSNLFFEQTNMKDENKICLKKIDLNKITKCRIEKNFFKIQVKFYIPWHDEVRINKFAGKNSYLTFFSLFLLFHFLLFLSCLSVMSLSFLIMARRHKKAFIYTRVEKNTAFKKHLTTKISQADLSHILLFLRIALSRSLVQYYTFKASY